MHGWKKSVTAGEAEVMTDAEERSWPFHPLRAAYRSVVRSRKDDPEFREIWAIPHSDRPQSSQSQSQQQGDGIPMETLLLEPVVVTYPATWFEY